MVVLFGVLECIFFVLMIIILSLEYFLRKVLWGWFFSIYILWFWDVYFLSVLGVCRFLIGMGNFNVIFYFFLIFCCIRILIFILNLLGYCLINFVEDFFCIGGVVLGGMIVGGRDMLYLVFFFGWSFRNVDGVVLLLIVFWLINFIWSVDLVWRFVLYCWFFK